MQKGKTTNMEPKIVSTAYAPLQPPYQIIKYDQDVAMQIGTLIVTVQKCGKDYQIETHSHPVVAYENKNGKELANEQLTDHQFLEGAVWNNVEVRDVTTICLAGVTLTWRQFIKALSFDSFLHIYRNKPDAGLYWHLKKLGVTILPPEERECAIQLELCLQPEETGLSLQSVQSAPLFLNVSVAEDSDHLEQVFYNEQENKWDSTYWEKENEIYNAFSVQLYAYRLVLRDLLYHEDVNHFTVTYTSDDKRFQKIVEYLNQNDKFVNLAYY